MVTAATMAMTTMMVMLRDGGECALAAADADDDVHHES